MEDADPTLEFTQVLPRVGVYTDMWALVACIMAWIWAQEGLSGPRKAGSGAGPLDPGPWIWAQEGRLDLCPGRLDLGSGVR